jgi:hypothetical protein
VPCVNGDLTVNNNLIKTSVKPENLGVDGNKSPKVKEEKPKIDKEKKPKPQDISIEKTEVVETIVKPIEKTFDKKEVVSGFEEAKAGKGQGAGTPAAGVSGYAVSAAAGAGSLSAGEGSRSDQCLCL